MALGIIDYLIKPEAVPYLGWIDVAPDFIVHASRLRWNAGIRDLEYHTLADGWVPLDRFHRSLLEGGTADSYWRTEFFDEHRQGYVPPASLEFDPKVYRPFRDARFAAELGVTIYVTQHFRVTVDGRLESTGLYEATAERGDFRLIDLASGFVAVFTTSSKRATLPMPLCCTTPPNTSGRIRRSRAPLTSIPPELRLSPLEDTKPRAHQFRDCRPRPHKSVAEPAMTLEPNDPPLARNPTTPAAGSAAMRVANLTDYRVRSRASRSSKHDRGKGGLRRSC